MKKTKTLKNKNKMDKFTEHDLPSLSTAVLGALELFTNVGLPKVRISNYKKPIIVGSGNAIVTAKLLYGDKDAIFADENNYKTALKRKPDGAIIFSASGEKHGAVIANFYKSKNLKTTLVTCNSDSSAGKILGKKNVVVTNKNKEPYTYNTSTYMGWIFAKTKEDPKKILTFINKKVAKQIKKSIAKYNGYLLVTPESFALGNHLFEVKFIELFARRVARDVKTFEELKHAITVIPYNKELCIQFGSGKVDFANDKIIIPLPPKAGPAAIMAIGYYVIGKIQEGKPQWFKQNIEEYISRANKKSFGKGLKVIVE
ncbi:hypothetical protein HON36_04805 [Candidatus Parcubacteria bacterium]|jgi:hypothetical protein|nr:hypothetical protein [Candidatus Parcubacteria bacterium]MBT7228861.1 hypothetical protein [Candidatus Parcubacteria bacterium]